MASTPSTHNHLTVPIITAATANQLPPTPPPTPLAHEIGPLRGTVIRLTNRQRARCRKRFPFHNPPLQKHCGHQQLFAMRRCWVKHSMDRLRYGSRSQNGASFGPAVRNALGCILVQKVATREGYVQVKPCEVSHRPDERQAAILPQLAHRMAMWEVKDRPAPITLGRAGRQRPGATIAHQMVVNARLAGKEQMDVSHLCHHGNCINVDHMVMETSKWNNTRRNCVEMGLCVEGCQPPCLFMEEEAEAEAEE